MRSGTRKVHRRDGAPHWSPFWRGGKPVEGYKPQVLDNVDGVVLHHTVVVGNPADAPMLVPLSPG